jgi:ribonuclease-3 family protein
VEKTVNFEHFQLLMQNTFIQGADDGVLPGKYADIPAERRNPLVLAYVGDAYFTLYVRTRLLAYEQNQVRILHTYDAKMVSATMQALAYRALADSLTEDENNIVRRGRNAKSTVPKSATVGDYRYSTGFEALLGYLFLSKNYERLSEIAEQAFLVIAREMTNKTTNREGKT